MGTWVGLFLSLQNKGVLSIARGRSPGRKRCEDVTWVLGWETAQACFFHSAPCGGIQTSHMNTAHCWNQGRILNAHEKRVQIASRPPRHGIQEAVSPGRVWSDACGGRHLGTSFWEESSVPWWLSSLGTTLWAGFFPTFGETGRERPSKASHGESENRRPHSDPNQEASSHQPSCCGLWGKSHCFLCT